MSQTRVFWGNWETRLELIDMAQKKGPEWGTVDRALVRRRLTGR